jgi:hypothetical protein
VVERLFRQKLVAPFIWENNLESNIMNEETTKPVIQPTGEATGFIPAPGDKGKPITVIGTAAIRDAFDAKCIEQALNSRGAPGVTDLVLNPAWNADSLHGCIKRISEGDPARRHGR